MIKECISLIESIKFTGFSIINDKVFDFQKEFLGILQNFVKEPESRLKYEFQLELFFNKVKQFIQKLDELQKF